MNVLKPQKQNDLRALVRAGYSFREIERRLGIRRETVSRYAKAADIWPSEESKPATVERVATEKSGQTEPAEQPKSNQSLAAEGFKQSISACAVHHQWIDEQVRLGRNAVSIYQDLVERFAFVHKYNSVKRYVRRLKKVEPKQYDRLEFLPGEEAQVDYGQGALTHYPRTGKNRRPRLFVMTLKYSRRSFRKTVWKSGQEIWARLHEEAFRYFGGCPQYVVLDNLKEGVLKPDIYEPELNPVYATMLSHYGVVADPARVGDPNRKGTVENAIQHTQDTALKGRKFESIEEQNEWLMHWEECWAARRIHGRTKRQVEQMFQEERPHLRQLPLTPVRYFKQEIRTVWDDACINVGNAYYAARPAPLYSEVVVRIYDFEIEILDPKTMEVIRRHSRSYRPGKESIEEEDRIFNPSRKTHYLLEQAEAIGPKTRELCELLFCEQGRPGQRRMQGIVALARRHPKALIEGASTLAVERGLRSCRAVRQLVERLAGKDKEKEYPDSLTQVHKLIRSPSEYAVFWEQYALWDMECQMKGGKDVLH
ncbi:MAG: IS21 family transposase [Desulfobacterales bacterium]|nr:IS21 family transposase [Desulfobacterales bacterium]